MKKTYIIASVAVALAFIGGGHKTADAQACPDGKVCSWLDVSNVRSFGVVSSTRNGINFYGNQQTKDHLCQISGYDGNYGGYEQNRQWNKCNDEYYVVWNGSDWYGYKCDARTYTTAVFCSKDAPNAAPTISWSQAPDSAECNASYTIQASGSDADGNLTAVSIDKDGSPFAYAGGGDGYNGTSENPTSDTGPKSVTFTAWATDSKGARSGTISHTVNIAACAPANVAPTISWSQAPDSAQCNASYTVEATAGDANGNLATVSIDKNGIPFAYAGGGNGSVGTSGNPTADSGPQSITYTAWATDSAGARSGTISHAVSIQACNKPPQGTFLASCGSLSGTAYDPDSPGQSIGVHFYVDGPAGSGTFVGATNTNGSSQAYSLALPDSLKTNTSRTIYAYGIDTQGGNNPQIGTATINCAPPAAPAPSGFIAASPSRFSSSSGGSVTVSWSVSDASSCTASGDWSGTKPTSGSETRNVTSSSRFALSCVGAGGTWSDSANVVVPGNMTITHFSVSPNSVQSGDQFTISAGATWDGVNYLRRHRAYFEGSQGGNWTDAASPSATTLVTNGTFTAAQNPYSMYKGPGTYTIIYEAQDTAGHDVTATLPFTYQGPQCSTVSHTCSASYSGYEYPQAQSTQTLTVYQSCDISPDAYAALNVPSGTATLANRAYNAECPQCWADTHQYQASTWHCDRTLSGYTYPYFQSTFPITYYTSCTISDAQKQQLIAQGYTYSYTQRTFNASPGQWTDVHYMSTCDSGNTSTSVPVSTVQATCGDPAADNFGQQASCSYSTAPVVTPVVTPSATDTTSTANAGTGGGAGTGTGGGASSSQPQPGFTVTSDTPTAQIQFLGGQGAASMTRTIEVNPVSGFNENVTLSVKSINVKGGSAGLPAGVIALYSFDGKDFLPNSATVQQFNSSIGGGRYIGEHGTVGSTFRISFSKAVTQPYEVTIQGVSASGKTAEYVLTIDPTGTNPSFREI